MADFDLYAPKLRKFEGGFVNDPTDKGGATMMGVTLGTYRQVFGESKSVEDLKAISNSEWKYIMKGKYWDLVKADQIRNQSIAEIFSDWCVNSGAGAIRKVQRLFGLSADGIVGPKTLEVLNASDSETVFNRIKSARISFYRKIVITNPSQEKFLNGWLNRVRQFSFIQEA